MLSLVGGSLMAATPSSPTGLATPTQRAWKILTLVLAGLAVMVSMAWTPALLSISIALDPGRNSSDPIENYNAAQQQAMIAQAKQQFSLTALICLVALVALVALAIVAGRRALRETASTAALVRLGRWSLVCLVGGLALAPVIFLFRFGNVQFYYSYIEQPIRQLSPLLAQVVISMALGLIPASQVVSVILSGIALLRPTAGPSGSLRPQGSWRAWTLVGMILASLIALLMFTAVYLVALLFIGFMAGFSF
jgi:hypothetical protein